MECVKVGEKGKKPVQTKRRKGKRTEYRERGKLSRTSVKEQEDESERR